jgi:hypothetical protein
MLKTSRDYAESSEYLVSRINPRCKITHNMQVHRQFLIVLCSMIMILPCTRSGCCYIQKGPHLSIYLLFMAAKFEPDGYTLLVSFHTHAFTTEASTY